MKVVAGKPADLAEGTVLAGRFRILRVVGAGGMGTVYLARDQTLARDVAIKLHHATSSATRLQREAIAMARLAHPNVVTVFEVGELEQRPFVVMEYVAGTTLRAWAPQHSVREQLAILIAAGDGLAAAHDAGLVHRDFKPENVLIGNDGRARVSDFGLARDAGSQDDAPPPPADAAALLSPMTATGALLGTPAYMAPEQFTREPIDARADQFAFCVTAWEVLWRERPFAGSNFGELQRAIVEGVRRAPPPTPRVPGAVRDALERGLAVDPTARFGDMHALLAALRRALARRRRRWYVLGGAAALAGGIAFAVVRAQGVVSCDAPPAQLPSEVVAALRGKGASEDAMLVERAIASEAAAYERGRRFACTQGRIEHQWSTELAERSEACLDVGLAASRRILEDARSEPDDATAIARATDLASLGPCTDPSYLAAMRPLPQDPGERASLVAARADLAAALSGYQTMSAESLRGYLARLEASPARGEPTIAAGLTLLRGRLAVQTDDIAAGVKLVGDAYYAARAIDDSELAADAASEIVYDAATGRVAMADAHTWARIAVSDAERGERRTPAISANLYIAAARLADTEGDAERSLALIRRAKPLLDAGSLLWADAAAVEAGVEVATGKVDEGLALYGRAIDAYSARLGKSHPLIGSVLSDEVASLLEAGRDQQALDVAQRALAILQASPSANVVVDGARANLAAALLGVDRDDDAERLLEQARRGLVAHYGDGAPMVAHVDENLGLIASDRGDHARALQLASSALARYERAYGKDSTECAHVEYSLATTYAKLGRRNEVMPAAARAIAIYKDKSPGSAFHHLSLLHAAELAGDQGAFAAALRYLDDEAAVGGDRGATATAWAQLERGRALLALHRAAEAKPLLAAARAGYTALHMQARVDEIDRLTR